MDKATRALTVFVLIFAILCLASLLAAQGASAGDASAEALGVTPEPTITPIDLRSCLVGGRQADYAQTGAGVTILPLDQHDIGGYNQWQTTWRVTGPAGAPVEAEVVTYRCIGLARTPEWDHCSAELATVSTTQTISLTVPVSGTADFTVTAAVDCCEIDQNDLLRVNGSRWGASFFVRWAESPRCPFPGPSRTPTVTSTPSATPTSTLTPTPTATPPFHKKPWHDVLMPGYGQRYNITVQNTTGSVMPAVVITDVIPNGARFSDATIVVTGTTAPQDFSWYAAGGEWDGNRTVVWQVGDLPAGYYATMKVHVYAHSNAQAGSYLTNTARLSSGGGPAILASASTLIMANPETPTPRATPTFTPAPLCAPAPVVQVNVGSAVAYTDTGGGVWQADQAYSGANSWGYIGESGTYATSDPVWGTGDQPLYQTERFWTNGSGGYRFVTPNGDYDVLLKFAEIYPGVKIGTRVFSVRVQGATAIAHLDLTELVGANVSHDVLTHAQVSDGLLSVDVLAEQNFPALKAIAVLRPRPCTPTVTPSPTASATATATGTATTIPTPAETSTATPSATATATWPQRPPATPSETATVTATATATGQATATETPTELPTATMTRLATKTATGTVVANETPAPTATPTETPASAPTATLTATPLATPTATALPSLTWVIVLPIIITGEE